MSFYNVYIGGKAEFGDGSKWKLLYKIDQDLLNPFPLEAKYGVRDGAFVLPEVRAKSFWSDDFAAWFALTACSGLYVGEPENGGPKILTRLTAFNLTSCRGACEATSANGMFLCSLKAVFECETLGYDRGLGMTACYRRGQVSALVEFRVAVERGVGEWLQGPSYPLFGRWPDMSNENDL